LEGYFTATDQTTVLLERLWQASSTAEAMALRRQAELHAAENAGPRLVEASDALERLLLGVAEVGKNMLDEGTSAIRLTSLLLVLGSLVIAVINLRA